MAISDNFVPNESGGNHSALPRRYQTLVGDGAITIADGRVFLDKASAIAATLDSPPDNMDGAQLRITGIQAAAHTITQSSPGFNSVGSDSVATLVAAAGSTLELVAKDGVWYTINAESLSENITSIGDS